MSVAYCSVKLPAPLVVKDEVLEYRELLRALLGDILRNKGKLAHRYAKSLCFRIEFYDFPAVISRLEDYLNA